MTSPADELRAAATLLRETASKATPGPWTAGGYGSAGWTVGDIRGDLYIETEDSEQGKADAAWIALASPALAEPIAAALESAGNDLSGAEAAAAKLAHLGEDFDPIEFCDEPASVRAALAVARALNGGQQS